LGIQVSEPCTVDISDAGERHAVSVEAGTYDIDDTALAAAEAEVARLQAMETDPGGVPEGWPEQLQSALSAAAELRGKKAALRHLVEQGFATVTDDQPPEPGDKGRRKGARGVGAEPNEGVI
jgi:hypothetical protein